MNYNFIAIEGNIGSGKTSLAEKIASNFDAKLVLEQFEENPFLPKFYDNPKRFAFHTELTFLADRYKQVNSELANRDLFQPFTVSDYTIDKSLIFARINLPDDEFKLFSNLFYIMNSHLPKPDLLVYLYLDEKTLLENIKKRGRAYEQSIPSEYLQQIHEGYFGHLRQLANTKILIVDCNNVDFVEKSADYQKVVELLQQEHDTGIKRVHL
ncbi:MAG: hypothetical protein COA57_01910 [Flavobacteriales bacterium]|nr:MAG: hypothetical protein COA57_01910 [Flavobacteriales bacterium]